jgi:hypothetical protein
VLFGEFALLNFLTETFLTVLINSPDLCLGFGMVENDIKINEGQYIFGGECLVLVESGDDLVELL